jgi:hypothetical protein
LIGLGLIGAIAAADGALAQGKFEAQYVASVAGIPVGRGAWGIEIGDDQYATAASGRVTGVLRAVTSGEGQVGVRGGISKGVLAPSTYAVTVSSGGKTDEVQMVLASGTVKDLVAEPPFQPSPDRIPLTDAHRKGVLDPMSAGIIPVAGTGDVLAPEACNRTLAIFDGRQRFDLTLSFKRMDHVKADKGYEGPSVVCMVTYHPIAGHRPDRSAIKYLIATRDMEMWLAPIAGTRILVPFRISVPTMIGPAILQATQFVAVAQPSRATASAKTQ